MSGPSVLYDVERPAELTKATVGNGWRVRTARARISPINSVFSTQTHHKRTS